MLKLMKSSAVKFLFAFLMFSGCSRINNDSNQIALNCGISRQQAQDNTYLQISNENASPYDDTSSLFLSARFQDSETRDVEVLKVTRRGCVRLPERPGRIAISNKQQKMSAVYDHKPSLWLRSNPNVKIKSSPRIKASPLCQQDGIFSNREIEVPLQLDIQGNLEPVSLRIYAVDMRSKSETNLYSKDFSEPLDSFPKKINVQGLAEGIYYLRAAVTDYGQGFDAGEMPLISDLVCRLVILRQEPRIEGLNKAAESPIRVLSMGDKAPWTSSSPDETVFFCAEPYKSQPSCKAASVCQEPNNFKARTFLDLQESGIFNIFIWSRDRAGNQSPTSCETVVVSEQNPDLDVRWVRQDWNTDGGEVMDLPYAVVEAQAYLQHPYINSKDLEETLECRVDFLIQGRTPLKGKDAICRSGKCVGRNLEDFTPCSPDVQIDLRKIWQQKSIATSQLRLTVRANDRAGHIAEKTISVWINQSKWPISPLKTVASIQSLDPWLSYHDNFDQLLMKSSTSNPFLVKGEEWIETQIDSDSILKLLELQKGANGEIYAEAYLGGSSVDFRGVFHWTGKIWQKEDHTEHVNQDLKCREIYQTLASEVFCGLTAGSGETPTISKLAVWRDGWKLMDTPKVLTIGSERFLEDQAGRVWVFSNGSAYYRKVDDLLWQSIPVEEASEIFADRDSNVWLYVPNPTGNPDYFLRFESGRFEKVPLPPATQYLRDRPRLSPEGKMTFGAHVWEQSVGQWKSMEFPKLFAVTKSDYYPLFDNRGQTWWFDEYGLMGFLNQNYVYIPLNLSGLSCFDEGSGCGITITGEKTITLSALRTSGFQYETFTLKPEEMMVFDMESLGMPATKDVTKSWNNPDGSIEIQFGYSQAPTFLLERGRWVPGSSFKFPTGSFSHRMTDGRWLYSDRFGLHLQSGSGWNTVFDPRPLGYYGTIEKLWNLGSATVFRLGTAGSLYRVDEGTVTDLNSPGDKRFFLLGGALWGVNDHGFVRYRSLNFDVDALYPSSFPIDSVVNVFETGGDEVLIQGGSPSGLYLLWLNGDGTQTGLDFPFEFPEQLQDIARLGAGQYLARLSNGIYRIENGKWKILVSSKDLSDRGFMPGVYGMVLDAEGRLWFYQAGLLFRYDLNRPPVSFY